MARDRNGAFQSQLINRYERYENKLEQDICLLFLSGLSTRNISLISQSLLGRSISAGEVSHVNKELLTGIEEWRHRDLHNFPIKYMYLDGVNFEMRVNHSVELIPMLVIIGVTSDDKKVFLAIQPGDKESASTWREIFKALKARGLNANDIQLGIMDGLTGLEKVFQEEFPNADLQRCQVHVSRNVLSKVPQKMKSRKAGLMVYEIFFTLHRKKKPNNNIRSLLINMKRLFHQR